MGDIMSTVGEYLEHRGGYHDVCGRYHQYREEGGRGEVFSIVGI